MTLRSRLLISLLTVLATLGLAGLLVVRSQRHFLTEQVDEQVRAAVVPALGIARDELSPIGPRRPNDSPGPTALSELYVGVVGTDGAVATLFAPGVDATDGITIRLPAALPSRGSGPMRLSEPFDAVDGHGRSYRMVVATDPVSNTLVIGLPASRVDAAVNRLLLGFSAAAAVVVAVAALAAGWVVRLGLRPIKAMTDVADAIARGEVGRRVDHPSPRTEAGRLGRAFNVMLDEREGSEERLRRFVSDASHELRTPLTSIRGYVDLYRKGGLRGAGELDDAMRRVAGEGVRMGALVEDLLLLARLDEGRPLADEPLDLAPLLRDAAGDATALHPNRPISADIEERLPMRGDEARLRQVIAALMTNALVHTPSDATVHLAGFCRGELVIVEVRDAGPGMPADVAAKVFERFFRGDPARTRHAGGSGLGLSIVRSIVDAHGGKVGVESIEGTGTTVRVALPATGA